MIQLFNINFEFDKNVIFNSIRESISSGDKIYICVVDTNIVTVANRNSDYLKIINGSDFNICDGSTIALMGRLIYKSNFKEFTGPDLFNKYLNKGYRQCFLGNTKANLDMLMLKMEEEHMDISKCIYMSLPFCSIDEFDYKSIADEINKNRIEIIWVSLGAPKQEQFMNNLYPLLDKGVLVAVGAAFNYYISVGNYHRAPDIFQKFKLEWVYRFFIEPKKQSQRILSTLSIYPKLILKEYLKSNKKNGKTN